jgi:hypothetical protein
LGYSDGGLGPNREDAFVKRRRGLGRKASECKGRRREEWDSHGARRGVCD